MRGAAIGVLLAVGLAAAAPASARPRPARWYVDCSARQHGDGSRRQPWSSLAPVADLRLGPGARLLLRRGTACAGTLAPRGSGGPGRPAVIGAYGRGRPPRVDAAGEDAVRLVDQSHLTVQDLELTARGDLASRRRGVHLVADRALVRDVTIRRLRIHDVDGDLAKDSGGSGGVQADVVGGPPARFDRLTIEDNRIDDVSRSGIFIVGTTDGSRPRASEPWPEASTGVLVRGNRLARLGGDGIVPTGTSHAVVEDNVVSDGNLRGRPLSDPRGFVCDAGIWTFHANATLIQRNEVRGMRFNGCDGTAFDVDYDQDGTVVQFNYGHDDEGGFVLLCTDAGPRAADVRYNLSVDDRFALNQSPCSLRAGASFAGLRFYDNTIVAPQPGVAILGGRSSSLLDPAGLELEDNLLYASRSSSTAFPCPRRCTHNLFFGLPPSGDVPLTSDPLLEDPLRRGSGRLAIGRAFRPRRGSPARGAGVPVSASPRVDYLGHPVADPPTIGFAEPR